MRREIVRAAALGIWIGFAVSIARIYLPDSTPATDLHVYERAGRDLYELGNPYIGNAGTFFEFHYRYPPLLAMLMPVLRFVWFPLLALASGLPVWLRWRENGAAGLLFPLLLVGLWGQTVVNGNAQGFVVAALAIVPFYRRSGAVAVAFMSWLKLFPALVVLWYLGRRDWTALRWFGVTVLLLGLVQVPWLAEFVAYSTSPPGTDFPSQLSLRSFGLAPWIVGIGFLAFLTYRFASTDRGWLFAILLQVAALPRVNIANLAILLAHPTLLAPDLVPEVFRKTSKPTSSRIL